MNLIVCVKQVGDGSNLHFDPEANTLIREGETAMNAFDKNALEAALQIAEQTGGTVSVISLGPEKAKAVLKEGLAMGAEKAVLISGEEFKGSDIFATSRALALAIQKTGEFDLVLCGRQSSEGESSMVGAGIAEELKAPLITNVCAVRMEDSASYNGAKCGDMRVYFEREQEDGNQIIEVSLPAVVTVTKSKSFEPRFPSVRATMKANRAEIPVITAADLSLKAETCVNLREVSKTPPRTQGIMFEAGEAVEKAAELLCRLALT